MLAYYGWTNNYDIIKEWYDGYRFGSLGIYCPWDVVSYCHTLKMDPSAKPKNYWVNTSSNDIIRRFVDKAKAGTRNEIEQLIDGGRIKKKIRQELTYRDMDSDIDNLWSLLFTTGYLTQCGEDEVGIVIELKYAENAELDAGCRKALQQIQDRNYDEILIDDGMKTIYRYGIACYKKRCKVISG